MLHSNFVHIACSRIRSLETHFEADLDQLNQRRSFRLSIAATAALMGGAKSVLRLQNCQSMKSCYEVLGFPITPHQLVTVGSVEAQEGVGLFL